MREKSGTTPSGKKYTSTRYDDNTRFTEVKGPKKTQRRFSDKTSFKLPKKK